jgi:hypothetical protein
MSRWSLALLVTLAAPAFAQAPAPTAAEPVQAPPAAPAAPAAENNPPPAPTPAPAPAAESKPPAPAPSAEAKPPAPAPAAAAPAPTPEPKAAPVAAPTEAKPPPSAPAVANPAPAPAPAPAAKAPAPVPAPAPAAPAAPAPAPKPQVAQPGPTAVPPPVLDSDRKGDEQLSEDERTRRQVKRSARELFEHLLTGNVRGSVGEMIFPFQLEEKRYATHEELIAAWVKQLRLKRTDLVILYDIEVLTLPEMEKKYGKPPARLGLGNLKDPTIYAAVANLSGRAGVLLFLAPGTAPPRAFAYTD